MRTDPTDTGGLFSGRRPGTAPIKYSTPPKPGSSTRRRFDGLIAFAIGAAMVLVNLLFWGPIPAGGLWVGSQATYRGGSLFLGISVAFFVILAGLMFGLVILKRLDTAWVLVRRAAGHDQRVGIIGPVFGVCAVIGATAFGVWFLLLGGLANGIAGTSG